MSKPRLQEFDADGYKSLMLGEVARILLSEFTPVGALAYAERIARNASTTNASMAADYSEAAAQLRAFIAAREVQQ